MPSGPWGAPNCGGCPGPRRGPCWEKLRRIAVPPSCSTMMVTTAGFTRSMMSANTGLPTPAPRTFMLGVGAAGRLSAILSAILSAACGIDGTTFHATATNAPIANAPARANRERCTTLGTTFPPIAIRMQVESAACDLK